MTKLNARFEHLHKNRQGWPLPSSGPSKPFIMYPVYLLLFTFFISLTGCRSKARPSAPETTEPIVQLMQGNARFAGMHPIHPHESRKRMKEIAGGQHPIAAIVSCSDSRVPPELIFDQGLGDLFVIRTAGNLMGGLEIGSLEYAVEHLGVRQILVMGHKECGALKAFTEKMEAPGHIRDIVDSLNKEEEIRQIPSGDKHLLDACIRANILHGIHQLQEQSVIIAEKIRAKELKVYGALYDLEKGVVYLVQE